MSSETPPKVSVIVPVYNAEKYLRQCIDSLMAQTLKDVEYIFVNDGSTDGSLAILESYAAKDNRIGITTQQNAGPGVARNTGLAIAKGDYLSFLDADDFFEPTLLEETYNCAVTNDADVVMYSYWNYDNETGKIFDNSDSVYLKNMPSDVCCPKEIADTFSKIVLWTAWTKLFRREFILRENIKFPDWKFSEDAYVSFIGTLTAKRIARLNKKLLYYRTNQTESISSKVISSRAWQLYGDIKAFRVIRGTLIEKGIFSFFERGFQKLVNSHMQYLFDVTKVQDFSLKERLKVCREFLITVSPFAMFGMRIFLHDHSPQWFLKFGRAVRAKLRPFRPFRKTRG